MTLRIISIVVAAAALSVGAASAQEGSAKRDNAVKAPVLLIAQNDDRGAPPRRTKRTLEELKALFAARIMGTGNVGLFR